MPSDRRAEHLRALQIGAGLDPKTPAIEFLPHADPAEEPLTITHGEFIGRVTQAANLFHDLGVGPGDVVSLLLPLVPQTFFALFGAQAAGIANPVNPLLSPGQLLEILRAAKTKVLVALGPVPGSDIWDKVVRIKADLPTLKAVVVVHGEADERQGIHSFDALIGNYPADRLTSGRQIAAGDVAGYFHTGGTTGTPKLVRHTHGNQVYQAWAHEPDAADGQRAPAAVRAAAVSCRRGPDAVPGPPLPRAARWSSSRRRAGAIRKPSATSGGWSSATGRSCSAACRP